ncbi:MAG: signal peptide peptidase SppA [Deltaproteobacteria bacterium]|nr:signal peptide peptidase SppA [Deltaproteobacteria bacterium]
MKAFLKNVLAAAGAFFIAVVVISVLVSIVRKESSTIPFGDKVAVVEIEGIITDSSEISRTIEEYGERDDIKAVIVRIDSPGGAVGPSQEIYKEVRRLKERKKVVISMGAVAASGGYYIAVAGDKIVANPGTITGSIGVVIEFINVEDLFKKIGLKGYTVKSGKFKDTGSPFKPMSAEEEKLLQEVVTDVHGQFIDAVSEGRGIEREKVEGIADGRILSGAQALKLGLVDTLGNLADAINLGAELGGIKGKPSVIYPERPRGLWRFLSEDSITRTLGNFFMPGVRIMYILPDIAH